MSSERFFEDTIPTPEESEQITQAYNQLEQKVTELEKINGEANSEEINTLMAEVRTIHRPMGFISTEKERNLQDIYRRLNILLKNTHEKDKEGLVMQNVKQKVEKALKEVMSNPGPYENICAFAKTLREKYPDFRGYRLYHILAHSTIDPAFPVTHFDFPEDDSIERFVGQL